MGSRRKIWYSNLYLKKYKLDKSIIHIKNVLKVVGII